MNSVFTQATAPRLLSLTFALGALLLSGCSSIQVSQDYDKSANFSGLTQFQWQAEDQQVAPTASNFQKQNPLIAKRVENAIAAELQKKGLSLVDSQPNAYITYHASSQTKLRATPVTTSVGFGFGSAGRYGGVGFSSAPDIQEYEEGKLLIDILDTQGNLVWRGISTSFLNEQSTPEETTEFVNEVVQKIMAQFPPKSPS